jgi:hypothetical protein
MDCIYIYMYVCIWDVLSVIPVLILKMSQKRNTGLDCKNVTEY